MGVEGLEDLKEDGAEEERERVAKERERSAQEERERRDQHKVEDNRARQIRQGVISEESEESVEE